jgi:para-aminobenzoate synthetase component 1
MSDGLPLIEELTSPHEPEAAFRVLASRGHCVFLDSAMRHKELGRYSFLSADPFTFVEAPTDGRDALAVIAAQLNKYPTATIAGLPPFQGGAAGMLGYELGKSYERLPATRFDEFQVPALAIGFYDVVLAWDHVADRAWIISQGLPETEPQLRRRRAEMRLQQFQSWLAQPVANVANRNDGERALRRDELAPQYGVSKIDGLTSNFARETYLAAVQRAIDYIYAGDIFQVNLSQRLLHRAVDDAVSLYLRLRRRNPATFAGYFDAGSFQIASASPERFVQLQDGRVETRPIKGTRRRSPWPVADMFTGAELQASEKDRAENVMIVDLLRNDLSRVCDADSVSVDELCRLEVYETVQHLVSVVSGRLRQGNSAIDLLRATFPGGSITGAPKVRAMEIIAELEPTARGAYCGALGYIGFDGNSDWNILIRTLTASRGWWQLPVGGGIVAQSEPVAEYEETWHKAAGMLRALV